MNFQKSIICTGLFASALLVGCADTKAPPVAAAAAPVAAAAPAAAAPAAKPAQAAITDAALVDSVKTTLASPALNASHLNVSAKSGEITLSGDVQDGQQLAKIAMAVQKLPGVKAVIPDMTSKR
jgi:osmotically-inducible protein OsmY